MGSASDWDVMQQAARQLKDFGVTYDARVISAHRSPDLLSDYIRDMTEQGVRCFIAGAGAANAGLFAVAMLALEDADLAQRLRTFRARQAEKIKATTLPGL
jgi:phosphoribosylcarboxyaminoimidazole (NCAIR) mutase